MNTDITTATPAQLPFHPELTEHAEAIRRLGKRVIADVIEIGAHLSKCRVILKDDGGWRVWLKSELGLSPQTAGRFIQVNELSQGHSNLEHLNLPVSALYLLAAPSTPEAVKTKIIERAQCGETISVPEVKEAINNAKGVKQPAKKKVKAGPSKLRKAEFNALENKPVATSDMMERPIGLTKQEAREAGFNKQGAYELDLFSTRIGVIEQQCNLAESFELPRLNCEQARWAVEILKTAEARLQTLRRKIEASTPSEPAKAVQPAAVDHGAIGDPKKDGIPIELQVQNRHLWASVQSTAVDIKR